MITQRSTGRLIRLLQEMFKSVSTGRRRTLIEAIFPWAEYRLQLYEEGVDSHVLDNIEGQYVTQPRDFLPAILEGTIPRRMIRHSDGSNNRDDLLAGQVLLAVFCEVALRRTLMLPDGWAARQMAEELKASLAVDGYELIDGRLVPATMKGLDLQQEDDYLLQLIRRIAPPNLEEILHHHAEADDTYVNNNWGSASTETRNFFIATLRGFREVARGRGKLPLAPTESHRDLIEDFQKHGLFMAEEKDAVLKLWVLLSYSGPHVGMQEDARARLTRLLVLGMTQWLCLKFTAWERTNFQSL